MWNSRLPDIRESPDDQLEQETRSEAQNVPGSLVTYFAEPHKSWWKKEMMKWHLSISLPFGCCDSSSLSELSLLTRCFSLIFSVERNRNSFKQLCLTGRKVKNFKTILSHKILIKVIVIENTAEETGSAVDIRTWAAGTGFSLQFLGWKRKCNPQAVPPTPLCTTYLTHFIHLH